MASKINNHPSVDNFAHSAARAALSQNNNVQNVPVVPRKNASTPKVTEQTANEIDRIVVSVENATKRLSQISTNTNSSKRKSKNHVGPWRLGRTLGKGSTGRVRLAKHSETGQLAAVKIVPKSKFQKDGKADKAICSPYGIEREIIIMKLISHPNIMALYDVWENKGELYLVLEYVEGGELFDYLIKKGKLPEREAVHYFRQIISGVSYCHQFNICHRDLKPENLLLDKNNNIKIADFGMAALEMNQQLLETSCGSPHYASPEIVTGKSYHGSPSDIWSCGIILFALLTGHLPFDDENIRNLLLKVRAGRFVMPNYLTPEAKDLIWKMLKVNPAERIKINDIFKHTLLKKYETSALLKTKKKNQDKVDSYYNDVSNMVLKKSDIDQDILKSLSVLFHGATEQSLIPKLISRRSNPERMFYYLLLNYKQQHQTKEKSEMSHKNSKKKKIGAGDGTLKKSKSMSKTTITNEDGSQIVKTEQVEMPPIPVAPVIKSIKNASGQIQISASNSYRRGISFNTNNNGNRSAHVSRSSSRRSFASNNNNAILKKHKSILPPLPDLDVDWLSFGDDGMPKGEFAELYEEIFNFNGIKKEPKSRDDGTFITSSPLPSKIEMTLKQEEDKENMPLGIARQRPKMSSSSPKVAALSPRRTRPLPTESHPPSIAAPVAPVAKLPPMTDVDYSSQRRAVTEPTPELKPTTLDPSYKKSGATDMNPNAVLQRLGVSLQRDHKTRSKIYYSKSSTSINLAAILQGNQDDIPPLPNADLVTSTVPATTNAAAAAESSAAGSTLVSQAPDYRISSSNYGSIRSGCSDDDGTISVATKELTKELTFDFEVPTMTEVATAVPMSAASNVTVGSKLTPREDSMFVDVAASEQNLLKLSTSTHSTIKHHRKASTDPKHIYAAMVDFRGSLYNNPSDLRDDDVPVPQLGEFERPKFSTVDDFNETKSSIMDNSIFADNTDDDLESGGAKRVTMIFDDFQDENDNDSAGSRTDDSPVKSSMAPFAQTGQESPTRYKPAEESPLKKLRDDSFVESINSVIVPPKKLTPQRPAPSAPLKREDTMKKSNWFTKFFSSLMSSESDQKKKKKKQNTKLFETEVPVARMRKSIEVLLELKRKEGTLRNIKATSDTISATVPAAYTLGSPLKFEIKFSSSSRIELTKIKGPKKVFKNLVSAMDFVVETELQRYKEENRKV